MKYEWQLENGVYRHAVTFHSGSILPDNAKGTYDVVRSFDPSFWPNEGAAKVRVKVGPGCADFISSEMYISPMWPEENMGPVLATTRHTGVKPVHCENPFSAGWDAVATPFARSIDLAIDGK